MKISESTVKQIEGFCQRHHMSETAFGIAVAGDGHLVRRLREETSMSVRRLDRVLEFIAEKDQAAGFVASDVPQQRVG